jgi:ubiquinone/menaquinone biosynthesis C-methylase UbiE
MKTPARSLRPTGRRGRGRSPPSPVRINREYWERASDEYDRRYASVLSGRSATAWGLWRIPESRLTLLGATRGRTILEVGCGAGRWSIALAASGARAVGLDFSRSQLAKARRLSRRARRAREAAAFVRGDAERLPFRRASFDTVFADWGAFTFGDPRRLVPEAARVLRSSGRLVFATSSPLRHVVTNARSDRIGRKLLQPYFGLEKIRYGDEIDFTLPYGEWIRLFRASGFEIESLLEPAASRGRRSRYLTASEERWGRRWPLESIWSLVKS